MSTFREFDYRVRPAKQIERRMIGECLSRLSRLEDVSNYPYIGFGSIAFMDFVLMHRLFGSKKMVSIEHASNAPRMEHNRPYRCIEVIAGTSHQRLAQLDWTRPAIVWLDYDGAIDENKILDVGLCAERLKVGSFLAVTLPFETQKELGQTKALFEQQVPSRYISGFTNADFSGVRYAKVLRTVLNREIAHKLLQRTAGTPKDPSGRPLSEATFEQVLFFTYRDGARMLTLGWFVDDKRANPRLSEACKFEDLDTYRGHDEPLPIDPPVLTPHEIRILNAQLPCGEDDNLSCEGVSERDVKAYRAVYRHFPLYFEVTEG